MNRWRALEFVRAMMRKALYRALEAAGLPNDKTRNIHAFYSGGKVSNIGISPQFNRLRARTYISVVMGGFARGICAFR
jgi:hypothetical protein